MTKCRSALWFGLCVRDVAAVELHRSTERVSDNGTTRRHERCSCQTGFLDRASRGSSTDIPKGRYWLYCLAFVTSLLIFMKFEQGTFIWRHRAFVSFVKIGLVKAIFSLRAQMKTCLCFVNFLLVLNRIQHMRCPQNRTERLWISRKWRGDEHFAWWRLLIAVCTYCTVWSYCPIWVKFSIKRLNVTVFGYLWAPRRSAQGRLIYAFRQVAVEFTSARVPSKSMTFWK
jgi:hypothetical protein